MIVGLTGGIGSGKSEVSRLLADQWSVPVVDADRLAREVVAPGTEVARAIAERYPAAVRPNGSLDRSWLRHHVLPDDRERQWLESVTHPAVRERIVQWLRATEPRHDYVVLESPLLVERGQAALCDLVVVVDALESQQLERASRRDGQTPEQTRAIMSTQLRREERLQRADIVLDNTRQRNNLPDQVARLHKTLSSRAGCD